MLSKYLLNEYIIIGNNGINNINELDTNNVLDVTK